MKRKLTIGGGWDHLVLRGDRWFSYFTCIKQALPGGLSLGNITAYTRTSRRHQVMVSVRYCDVQLDDVPRGATDLLTIAVQRGLVETSLLYNPAEYGMTTQMVRLDGKTGW